jgi:hypothetical protein
MKWYWWALLLGGGAVAVYYIWFRQRETNSADQRDTVMGAALKIASDVGAAGGAAIGGRFL